MGQSAKAARRQRDRAALAIAISGVAGLLMLSSMLLWLIPAGSHPARDARIGGPFSLIADDGRQVTDRSFPGKYLLIYFGYTSCRDICPATLNTLAAAIDRLGRKADLVQPIFITIDPAHDTPLVLRRYLGSFAPHLLGLTGQPGELHKVAEEYRVTVDREADMIDHSSVIYLMAPNGRFVAPIPAGATEMVMAEAITRHVD